MKASTREDTFWTSKKVNECINNRMANLPGWAEPDGVNPWQVLRADIIQHNSKGRPKGTIPPSGRILMEQVPEINDGVEDYPRFRYGLFTFAEILILFHQQMHRRFGADYWKTVRAIIVSDAEKKLFCRLLEDFTAIDTLAMVDSLEQIGRKGIRFNRPGGIKQQYRNRDCGIEPLVLIAQEIENLLKCQSRDKKQERESARNEKHPNSKPRVTVTPEDGGRIKLTYNGRSRLMPHKISQLVYYLFVSHGPVSPSELWQKVFNDDGRRYGDRGTEALVRNRKRDAAKWLEKQFGELEDGIKWIRHVKDAGYILDNYAVNWAKAKNWNRSMTDL